MDLKSASPMITAFLPDFVKFLLEHISDFNVSPRLLTLSVDLSFKVHIIKEMNCHTVLSPLVADSREVLEGAFVISEQPMIQQLFQEIGGTSNISMISLTLRADDKDCVIGTSVFGMCEQGCYISYVAVVEKDIWGITEHGLFRQYGIASLLVCAIQLVSYVNFNTWNLYCWSNNKRNDKKKDLWHKLGFSVLHSIENQYWPKEIEELAEMFHLPLTQAKKAGLIPKGILSNIRNFDSTGVVVSSPEILTLQYYRDGWFDYTAHSEYIEKEDPRMLCLQWLEEKIEFCDLPEDSPESIKKFYYIFHHRFKHMLDTIALTGEDEDLKEISEMEGYMSEIALDYCMMLMFFQVDKIFPIQTHVFNLWNINLDYQKLREHYSGSYIYTDCDIMEEYADDRDFKFVIPCFHGSHFYIIVRRWIDDKIYFFFNDSNYKTERVAHAKSTTSVPREIYAFLMDSPLWPQKVSVNWVRVPGKEQDEDECGFRTLLHAYILVMTDHPLTSLIPLSYFGSKALKKSHEFFKYNRSSLPLLCRQWVKEIMFSKKWQLPDWITEVLQYKKKSCSTTINPSYCLKICCTEDIEKNVKFYVRDERKRHSLLIQNEKNRVTNQDNQLLLSSEQMNTEEVQHCITNHALCTAEIVENQDQQAVHMHSEPSPSIATEPEQMHTEEVQHCITNHALCTTEIVENQDQQAVHMHSEPSPSIAAEQFHDDASASNMSDISQSRSEHSCANGSHDSNESDVSYYEYSSDDDDDSSNINFPGEAPWKKAARVTAEVGVDLVNASESGSAVYGDSSDAVQLPQRTIVIRTQDMSFTRQLESTDDCHSSNNGNDNVGEPLLEVEDNVNEGGCLLNTENIETRQQSWLDIEEDCAYRVMALEEQPAPRVQPLSQKKARTDRLLDKPVDCIESCCDVCTRPVKHNIKCSKCEKYIHDVCGFLQSKDIYRCNNCHNSDPENPTGVRRRLRLITRRDTEISELWNLKHTRNSSASDGASKLPKVPPVTREQQTVLFNHWLSQVSYMLCKRARDGNFVYYGCHGEYSNIQEIYSKYVKETLFENEEHLLEELQSEENLNKWCRLPLLMVRLIRARGECYSSNEKFIAFDKLEQQEWAFIKLNTYDREQCIMNYSLVDSAKDFAPGSCHVSLRNSSRKNVVPFVPKYFIYRWHHFCDKYKDPKLGNELSYVLDNAMKSANKWVRIQAGRFRILSGYISNNMRNEDVPNLPLVYRVQRFGENSCVFSSLISALHYMNDYKTRDLLSDHVGISLCYHKMSVATESLNRDSFAAKLMNQKGKYQCFMLKDFDIFQNRSMWPTLCILESSDGGISHAVTVVDNYIFDSSTYRAMEINRKNLDWCCGTDYYNAKFIGVFKAYRFVKARAITNILIRQRDDIIRAIRAFIYLFMRLNDRAISMELDVYKEKFMIEDDFVTNIIGMASRRPYLYMCNKIEETNFGKLLADGLSKPMVLVLGNFTESYKLITVYRQKFYDGSMNPGFPLTETILKRVLNWQNIKLDEIKIVRGYMFSK